MAESHEPLFRFSLRTLCVWLVFAGLFCAGFITGARVWATVLNCIVLLVFVGSTILSVRLKGADRVFGVSLSIVALICLAASMGIYAVPNYGLLQDIATALHPPQPHLREEYLLTGEFRQFAYRAQPRAAVSIGIGRQAVALLVGAITAYLIRAIYIYWNRKSSTPDLKKLACRS